MTVSLPAFPRWIALVGLLLVTSFASEALAGEQSRRGLRMIDRATLLSADIVRKELAIDAELGKSIDALLLKKEESWQKMFREYRGAKRGDKTEPPETPEKLREKLREKRQRILDAREQMTRETEAALVKTLNETQNKRLNEILLQYRGLHGLLTERVAKDLELTEEQKVEIRAAITARQEKEDNARPPSDLAARKRLGTVGGAQAPATRRELFALFGEEARKRSMDALSAKQRTEVEQLQGKPFLMNPRSLFRRRFLGVEEGIGFSRSRGERRTQRPEAAPSDKE